jgi:Zn finger protein HypA/HybF involved in hydrogenase expression
MDVDEVRLDGNAAAGLLEEIFAFEVTVARAVCSACDGEHRIAELTVYALEMGAIMRCPGCGEVMARISKLNGECWIDSSGMRTLRIQLPS